MEKLNIKLRGDHKVETQWDAYLITGNAWKAMGFAGILWSGNGDLIR